MKIGWYYTVGVWMIIVFSLGSCQEEQVVEVKSEEFSLPVTLEVDGYAHMDSAQVFFFRKFPDRDSLVFRQMVYDLGMQPRQIDFTLPLGVYDVLILGNVATDRIFERPPFSRDSICFFYTGEQACHLLGSQACDCRGRYVGVFRNVADDSSGRGDGTTSTGRCRSDRCRADQYGLWIHYAPESNRTTDRTGIVGIVDRRAGG